MGVNVPICWLCLSHRKNYNRCESVVPAGSRGIMWIFVRNENFHDSGVVIQYFVFEYVPQVILRNACLRTTGLEDNKVLLYPCPHETLGSEYSDGSWVPCSCSHCVLKHLLLSVSLRRDHSLVSVTRSSSLSETEPRKVEPQKIRFSYNGAEGCPGLKLMPRALGQDLFQHLIRWELRNTIFLVTTTILFLLIEQLLF